MDTILTAAGITVALVEIIKKSLIKEEYGDLVPFISLMTGMFIGFVFFKLRGLDVIYVGLIASGSYDVAKKFYLTIKR